MSVVRIGALAIGLVAAAACGLVWAQGDGPPSLAPGDYVTTAMLWRGLALILAGNLIAAISAAALIGTERQRIAQVEQGLDDHSDSIDANTTAIVKLSVEVAELGGKVGVLLDHFELGDRR